MQKRCLISVLRRDWHGTYNLGRSEDWEGVVLLERMEHLIGKEKFPVFIEYEKER